MIVLLALGLKTTYAAKEYEPAHIVLSVRDSVKSYTMFAQNKKKRIQRLNALGTLLSCPVIKAFMSLSSGNRRRGTICLLTVTSVKRRPG